MEWIWLAVIVFTVLLEMITPGSLISIWFSAGALIALLISFFSDNYFFQSFIFLLTSVIFIILVRPLTTSYFRGNIIKTNSDALIGKHAKVVKDILPNERGEVIINGNIWLAVDIDNQKIEAGKLVSIIAIDGVKLIVRKMD